MAAFKSYAENIHPAIFFLQTEYLKGHWTCDEVSKGSLGFSCLKFHQKTQYILDFLINNLERPANNFNAGLGFRYFGESKNMLFGINTYYDSFSSSIGTYHQVGAGLEWLSCWGDIRMNVYFPLGDRIIESKPYIYDRYEGDYWVKCYLQEQIANGADLEIGHFCYLPSAVILYPSLGGYYLKFPHENNLFGVMARLKIAWRNRYSFQIEVHQDKLFKRNLVLYYQIKLPSSNRQNCYDYWNTQLIQRRFRSSAASCCRYETNY